jgi:translation initiation factor 2D
VTAAFPTLASNQVSELTLGKEELNVVKLYVHKGGAVTVYHVVVTPSYLNWKKKICMQQCDPILIFYQPL